MERKNLRLFENKSCEAQEVFELSTWRWSVWLSASNDFKDFALQDFYRSWEDCLEKVKRVKRSLVVWSPPPMGVFKFNVELWTVQQEANQVLLE